MIVKILRRYIGIENGYHVYGPAKFWSIITPRKKANRHPLG